MKSIRKQRGMTPIGWILVFALIAFFALMGLTLIPVYINGYKVKSIVASLEKEHDTGSLRPAEIIQRLNKRFDIDMVTGIESEDIYIERAGGIVTITVDYEVRKKFIGNIDFFITFSHSAEVPAR